MLFWLYQICHYYLLPSCRLHAFRFSIFTLHCTQSLVKTSLTQTFSNCFINALVPNSSVQSLLDTDLCSNTEQRLHFFVDPVSSFSHTAHWSSTITAYWFLDITCTLVSQHYLHTSPCNMFNVTTLHNSRGRVGVAA